MDWGYQLLKAARRAQRLISVLTALAIFLIYWKLPEQRIAILLAFTRFALASLALGLVLLPCGHILVKKKPDVPDNWNQSFANPSVWKNSTTSERFLFFLMTGFEVFAAVFIGSGFSMVIIFIMRHLNEASRIIE